MSDHNPGDALCATTEHVVSIQRKIDKLVRARDDAMNVIDDLAAACEVVGDLPTIQHCGLKLRVGGVPGRRQVWDIERRMTADHLRRERTMQPGETRVLYTHQHHWPLAPHFVYALMDERRRVFYIGETGRLAQRFKAHRKRFGRLFTCVEVIACESRDAEKALEADLIFQHQPTANQVHKSRRRMAVVE